jgi:TolB protein
MRVLVTLVFTFLSLFAFDATLEVIKETQKLPKVRVENITSNPSDRELGNKIAAMTVGDLKVTGHFDAYIPEEDKSALGGAVDYVDLRQKGVDLLVRLEAQEAFGEAVASFKVYDINAKQESLSGEYSVKEAERYPFLAHRVAIAVNSYIGAPTVDWMGKFVVLAKRTTKKESDIVIADYTLTYQKTLVEGGVNIFPKWADDTQKEIYFTALDRKPTLYKLNIYSGERQKILDSQGMIVCSDVNAKGDKLLVTMAKYDDQTDLFLYDIPTGGLKRVTTFPGIDVGGYFIDGDTRAAFVSDRLGNPNIFAVDFDSGRVEQMVYHGKNNVSLSAYKNYIVYSSRESNNEFSSNTFNLYLISTQSNFIRRLTADGINEFPRFSSDGDSVLFIKNLQYESALGIIRLNYNKSFIFPLKDGKIQSIDW